MSARETWDGLIVVCAPNGYGGTPMSDWHIARELSRHAPVLFVDPPVSCLTRFRNPGAAGGKPGLRVLRDRFAHLVTAGPAGASRPGVVGVTTALVRGQLARAVRRLGGSVRAVISGWPQYPVAGACDERVHLYWAKDDFVGGAELLGLNAGMLRRREGRTAAAASQIIVSNPAVERTWRERGHDPVLIPFGCDPALFAGRATGPPPGAAVPAAGFVGRLNGRTDLALLEAVADRAAVLITGPIDPAFEPRRMARLLDRARVRWAGPQPQAELPRWLRLMGAGLIPYRLDSAFNQGCFPLKALEYLAAGLPVVSTGLPAVRWLDTHLITVADTPEEFAAAAVKALSAGPDPTRQRFAAQHSWEHRAGRLLDVIDGLG
jgi:teichuronic acid biosynthesis glycosyltransferase TuaH